MKFVSTRGKNGIKVSAAEAIKLGLSSDGGLFMPEAIPYFEHDELVELSKKSYCERAAHIIGKFLSDYTYEELLDYATQAYSKEKFGSHPAPIRKVDERIYALELFHGPTCAFKDMALQIMPRLFCGALRKTGEARNALILVATSGDTGKAALEGYRDIPGVKIQVFYPTDGVSAMQKLQMQTQEGDNVSVKGIRGNFDDAQNAVKRIFSDRDMAKRLDDAGVFLSSANSINWGRLVPQIVYYVSAYLDMASTKAINLGEEIDVCVPTGNFGNIFAAYIAKLMGLPINKLICASNVNNVLTEFLETGTYDKNRHFTQTISPSMDILISSNLERLLFTVAGAERTAEYMSKLNSCGAYTVSSDILLKIKSSFIGICTNEAETRATISSVFKNKNYLIDTHTSVAMSATEKYINAYEAERKVLVVSTASPYKFAKDVYSSLVSENSCTDLEAPELLSAHTGTEIPLPLSSLCDKTVIHTDIIDKNDMDNAVLDFVKA